MFIKISPSGVPSKFTPVKGLVFTGNNGNMILCCLYLKKVLMKYL